MMAACTDYGRSIAVAAVVLLLGLGGHAASAEPLGGQGSYIELDPALISGDQELPRVLYILPWRQPDGAPLPPPDLPLSEDDLLRPLYPPAHRQEMNYHRQLKRLATEE